MLTKASLFIASCALAALLLLPGTAAAKVYCVDTTPADLANNNSIDASCDTATTTLTKGLELAEINPGTDSVLVGPGDYTLPAKANGIEANYNEPGQIVHVRGIGSPHLTMGGTTGSERGVSVIGAGGTTVEDLALSIPANVDGNSDIGFFIGSSVKDGAIARNLGVDAPAANNSQAISLGLARLVESRVTIPAGASNTSSGVAASNGDASLVGDVIEADTAINTSGNVVTIERSRFSAWHGTETDGGTLVMRDSLVRLQPKSGAIGVKLANDNKSNSTIKGVLDGVTIVGGEGFSSVGVRVQANLNLETAEATIADTVIKGPAKALQVWSDAGRPATATVSYSNYDPALVEINQNLDGTGAEGTSTYLPNNVTNLAPGFLDPGAGDFRLAASSPLLDLGDPTAPAAGAVDLAGNARALAGVCGAAPRRDIGAYEFAPICTVDGEGESGPGEGTGGAGGSGGDADSGAAPAGGPTSSPGAPAAPLPNTTIKFKRKRLVTTTGKPAKVTIRFTSTVAGATFRCRVDAKALKPCPAAFTTHLRPGKHRITAVAVTAAGADPTPATVKLTVVRKAG